MDIQEIWRNEMSSCCSMLIWDLHEKLLACKEKGMTTEICILPNYPASPRNEVLFDCVNLYVQSTASGEIEVRGILWDTYSKNGSGKQKTSSVCSMILTAAKSGCKIIILRQKNAPRYSSGCLFLILNKNNSEHI
jgi:hypothetical protein